MKIAAIKGKIGIWNYYVTAMRFEDIVEHVNPITEEISNSKTFSDMLQRAITDNVDEIKEYLIHQPERFFNALVLAVYDGKPEWYELEVEIEDFRTYSVGILELTGNEVIFPVDGQHRVEGIRKALTENPKLANEKVPVIMIGHENTLEGKQRTRRLFSTLNRRARKVNDNELIALDEDDVVAVATRDIIEHNPLFSDDRIVNVGNKNIPSTNHWAFTSIIELYECNKIIFDYLTTSEGIKSKDKKQMLLYRPDAKTVNKYIEQINEFWEVMQEEVPSLAEYVSSNKDKAEMLGNRSESGGNLLFRPIALTQYINALCYYQRKKGLGLRDSVKAFNRIPIDIHKKPWLNIIWTTDNKINGRARKKEVMNLMLLCVDVSVVSENDMNSALAYWAASNGRDSITLQEFLELI